MKQEVHILLGCADARDLNQVQIDTTREFIKKYKEKGIHIEMRVIRIAGSFASREAINDIKRTIEINQRETYGNFKKTEYYIHIQTHGHLDDQSNKDYISHIYEMNIVPGSPLNCGVLEAASVGIEIEQMLLEEHPLVETPTGVFRIDTDEDIQRLLKDVYAHEGYLAGDWIRSIDKLRTHPRLQKSVLEQVIRTDPAMSRLIIKITAGIQDYSIHGLIRLDNGVPKAPFWDDVQREIRKRSEKKKGDLGLQSQKQKPLAGLVSLSDPQLSSRSLAAQYYFDLKGFENNGAYLANTVFNISGSGFDLPYAPFGPYANAGFFYGVAHLNLTDQMVMGYDEEQTERMMKKISKDPIMALTVKKFGVNLIPVNQKTLLAQYNRVAEEAAEVF